MGLIETINRVIAPLARRVKLMVGRCVVDRVDDAHKEQVVQARLLTGELRTLERYQQYGFTSVPHREAEGIAVFVGGNRDHGILIATGDRRYRLTGLAAGEVSLYDDLGQVIHLKRGKQIEISGCDILNINSAAAVNVVSPQVNLGATAGVRKLIDERIVALFNAHRHGGGAVPDQPLALGDISTSNTKAI